MKYVVLLLISLTLFSCNDSEKTTSYLAFKSIGMGSLYNAKPEEVERFNKILDSMAKDTRTKGTNKKMLHLFNKLKNNHLLLSPYILLEVEKDSIRAIYLSEEAYQKVQDFSADQLISQHKKVKLELDVDKIADDLYYSENILDVTEEEGETRWEK